MDAPPPLVLRGFCSARTSGWVRLTVAKALILRRFCEAKASKDEGAPRLFQISPVPGEIALKPVADEARPVDRVILAGIDDELRRHAEAFQRLIGCSELTTGTFQSSFPPITSVGVVTFVTS